MVIYFKWLKFSLSEIQRREESLMSRLKKSKPEDIDVRETIFEDGTKEIFYPSGNVKKISPDNNLIRIVYYNGDIKETNIEDGSEKYYYSETETWHTTYKDGMEVLEFPT